MKYRVYVIDGPAIKYEYLRLSIAGVGDLLLTLDLAPGMVVRIEVEA